MKYQPLVSIIIPLYNGSNFIRQSIESALNQVYKNIEIIVVNDGSTDNGAGEKIVLEYQDRIKYFFKPNGGVSSALNLGIANMQGEWFSWLSHDDLYYPQKISAQVDFLNDLILEKNIDDLNNLVLFCHSELINDQGNVILQRRSLMDESDGTTQIVLKNLRRNGLNGCTFLIPKEAFRNLGSFNESLRTTQDYEFWYKLLFANYHFIYDSTVLVKTRKHNAQTTHSHSNIMHLESDRLYSWIGDQFLKTDEFNNKETFWYLGKCALERNYKNAASKSIATAKTMTHPLIYLFKYAITYSECLIHRFLRRIVKQLFKYVYLNQ